MVTADVPQYPDGGGGERKTLRLVAQYADACNLFARLGPEVLSAKLEVLKRHCEKVGRDYAQIEKTALRTVNIVDRAADPKKIVHECKALAAVGIQHCIFNMPNVHEIEPLRIFGREIIPRAQDF